ncbi:MAG: hypothetical protein K9J81_04865 [Desulfohalobiaceae bacterium]|nr:hypothetical protein [Desulfohalobiaceae bacterium]
MHRMPSANPSFITVDTAKNGSLGRLISTAGSSESTRELLFRVLAVGLDRLSQQERLVLGLFYLEEFTEKEIAEVLDLPERRVSHVHNQALLKLKTEIEVKGGPDPAPGYFRPTDSRAYALSCAQTPEI